ncbi:MAG TPA: phosphotransferase, partial [Acidimicrobiales bacterium]|nr:phosphotransferase [Acidimicrobiales bacterium]
IDVPTASFVLLLEDLRSSRTGDQLAGCSTKEAELAIDELVGLHAPLWADPWLEKLPWLHRDKAAQQAFLLGLLPQLWAGFYDRYKDRLGPNVREAGGTLFDHLDAYVHAETEPWTVVHGDYRLDNLLFSATGDRVAVVDWQTCTHGPGMQDIAYFIGAGLLADCRREAEEQLVARYHQGLQREGIAKYDFERCWHDYRRFTWAGLVMAVAASMLVERTERGDEMFMAMAHRHARHALDLGADQLLAEQ